MTTKWRNRNHWFLDHLKQYDRVALVGPSGAGKSTLSRLCKDRTVIHCDDFMHLPWSQASEKIRDEANAENGKLLVEGTASIRAVRKGMNVDAVLYLKEPLKVLEMGQRSQAAGIETIVKSVRSLFPNLPIIEAPPASEAHGWLDETTEDDE